MIASRTFCKNECSSPGRQQSHQLSVQVLESEQIILIKEGDNSPDLQFPVIWLRDNCLCDECFHKDSQSRKPLRWTNFDTTVQVKHITTSNTDQFVTIEWTDNHESTFELSWMKQRDFSVRSREGYIREWYRPENKLWGKSEFKDILKTLDYRDVMEKDEVLFEWLQRLAVYGVCMLKNSPLDIRVVNKLADRIGFIRQTTYGKEFSVKSRPGAKNYSYLSEPLPLHTDLPYYEYKPSVTILHTLEQSQSKGGWNTLTDAFNIAEQLRTSYPEHFRILTETSVDWCDIGMDDGVAFHNIWRAPVINLDADGKYTRINHSVPQRDSHFCVDIEKVKPWYEANAQFVRMAHEQAVSFKTEPGDVLTFNNLRMVHGRTGYNDTDQNVRHIVGAFVDWDIIYSKMRVLKKSLAFGQLNGGFDKVLK